MREIKITEAGRGRWDMKVFADGCLKAHLSSASLVGIMRYLELGLKTACGEEVPGILRRLCAQARAIPGGFRADYIISCSDKYPAHMMHMEIEAIAIKDADDAWSEELWDQVKLLPGCAYFAHSVYPAAIPNLDQIRNSLFQSQEKGMRRPVNPNRIRLYCFACERERRADELAEHCPKCGSDDVLDLTEAVEMGIISQESFNTTGGVSCEEC